MCREFIKLSITATHWASCSFFFMVLRSIGVFIIFRYVGNCFVFTGSKKGHASSCDSKSSSRILQGFKSLDIFFPLSLRLGVVGVGGGTEGEAAPVVAAELLSSASGAGVAGDLWFSMNCTSLNASCKQSDLLEKCTSNCHIINTMSWTASSVSSTAERGPRKHRLSIFSDPCLVKQWVFLRTGPIYISHCTVQVVVHKYD